MGGMVQQGEGRERKLGRHIAHAEGLGDTYKYHGRKSFSVLSQTTLPSYRDSPMDPLTVSLVLKLPSSSFTLLFLQQFWTSYDFSSGSSLLWTKQHKFCQTVIKGQVSQAFDQSCISCIGILQTSYMNKALSEIRKLESLVLGLTNSASVYILELSG